MNVNEVTNTRESGQSINAAIEPVKQQSEVGGQAALGVTNRQLLSLFDHLVNNQVEKIIAACRQPRQQPYLEKAL